MSKVILTADDSSSVRQMVSFTLKQAGYSIVEASDGKDALAKAQSRQSRYGDHRPEHAQHERY